MPDEWASLIVAFTETLAASGQTSATIDTRRQHLNHFARHIAEHPTTLTSTKLLQWCAAQEWARETRRGRYVTFAKFWAWAATNGHENHAAALPRIAPLPGIARPTPERIYLEAMLRSDARTRLILRLSAEAGLRRTEIALTHSANIFKDLLGYSLLVHGKGNRKRIVPLTRGLALDLLEQPEGWTFPGKIEGHLSPRRVGELATDALDGEWTLHTLRHRFATRTYSIDRDVLAVQQLLGHASPTTTQRYVATEPARLRALVDRAAS